MTPTTVRRQDRQARPLPVGRLVAVLVAVLATLVALPSPASAHPLSTSAVIIDVGAHQVDAKVELPLDQLSAALGASYTAADHDTYKRLYERQAAQLPGLACDAFIKALPSTT